MTTPIPAPETLSAYPALPHPEASTFPPHQTQYGPLPGSLGELMTGWVARRINGAWYVGMDGNLDTRHDATLKLTGGFLTDPDAEALARWIAAAFNSNLPHPYARPTVSAPLTPLQDDAYDPGGPLSGQPRPTLLRTLPAATDSDL